MSTTFDLKGEYSWELLFDIDNTQNAGFIRRTEEVKVTLFVSYNLLLRDVHEYAVKNKIGFESGINLGIVSVSMSTSMESSVASTFERTTNSKEEKTIETKKTTEIEIGPKSRLKLYRLVFNGPGISYKTDTLSSTPSKVDDVIIKCTVKPCTFLKDIRIVYTDDAVSKPNDSLEEVEGLNADINAGFGGKYVWLVPIWTIQTKEAITSIEVIIQQGENPGYRDMAKKAGGAFRYLKMLKDPICQTRISKIKLMRRESDDMKPSAFGWKYYTGNINRNRNGDYLYICWENTTL